MTLVQLRHFVVLAEWGSYVQACKALFLTQPALTRSIQGLEDELLSVIVGFERRELEEQREQLIQRAEAAMAGAPGDPASYVA